MPNTATATVVQFDAPSAVHTKVAGLCPCELVEIPIGCIDDHQGFVSNLKKHAASKTQFRLGRLGSSSHKQILCECSHDTGSGIFTIKAV